MNIHVQDDEDGHLIILNIIEELMCKTQEEFLEHFARLGVFSKVQALMDQGRTADCSCSRQALKICLHHRRGAQCYVCHIDQLQAS